jgi:hypothetical protein
MKTEVVCQNYGTRAKPLRLCDRIEYNDCGEIESMIGGFSENEVQQ